MNHYCLDCDISFPSVYSLAGHKSHHKDNMLVRTAWNKGLTKETDSRVVKNGKGVSHALSGKKKKPLREAQKLTISNSMKKAHAEGRAWNIGKSRWNNTPSYPETFFMKVIENEFWDKEYVREYPLSIYSLDFAWPHKKKCIEIDGEQHMRFPEYRERDERKDVALSEAGWECLRLQWSDISKDPKKHIKLAKQFIAL